MQKSLLKPGKEDILRNCYKKSLKVAIENNIRSTAFSYVGMVIYQCSIELGRYFVFEEAIKVIDKFDKIYFVCFGKRDMKYIISMRVFIKNSNFKVK